MGPAVPEQGDTVCSLPVLQPCHGSCRGLQQLVPVDDFRDFADALPRRSSWEPSFQAHCQAPAPAVGTAVGRVIPGGQPPGPQPSPKAAHAPKLLGFPEQFVRAVKGHSEALSSTGSRWLCFLRLAQEGASGISFLGTQPLKVIRGPRDPLGSRMTETYLQSHSQPGRGAQAL